MDKLPSAVFRKVYAKLDAATTVTVNGHAIGTWIPINQKALTNGELHHIDGDPRNNEVANLEFRPAPKPSQKR